MRQWLKILKKHGELLEITEEVDWKYEMGCLIRRIIDIPGGGPAVLFKNIKGYQDTVGKEYFTCSFSSFKRIALALGLPPEASYRDIYHKYLKGMTNPIPPVMVDDGPCKEVIKKGEDVDILSFPSPHFHPDDGGQYIGTFHLVVSKDYDTGVSNVGMYRMMVHDRNTVGALLLSSQDWEIHLRKWTESGRKMPLALCLGPPQTVLLTALASLEHPPDEYAVSGGLAGEAIKLVKCETLDLEVPADCEVVLEGHVNGDPNSFRSEGPLGEYMGYMTGGPSPKPVVEIDCMTHRKDPIHQGSLEGRCVPGAPEDHHCAAIFSAAHAFDLLRKNKVDVIDVHAPLGSNGYNKVIVAIRQHRRGEATQVASLLWGSPASFIRYKEVVVVDEDIDVQNPALVEFAITTRCDPANDITIVDNTPAIPLCPRIHPTEKERFMGAGRWARMCIDATRPFDWRPEEAWGGRRFPPVQHWPDEIEDVVEDKWEKYGLGGYFLPPRWKMTY
jgi:4-hydroxy-3-polyprenylbenzoate decarboxylase